MLQRYLTLSGMGGPFRPPLLENRDFSGTEPPWDLRPVCKFKCVRCGPVEKNKALYLFWSNRGVLTKTEDAFFKIIILCLKSVISLQRDIQLTSDQSVNSSLSSRKKKIVLSVLV